MQCDRLFIVFFKPHHPPDDTHDGVIQVDGCFAKQVTLYADENINDGVDQPNRVNQDILGPRVPYTGDTREYSQVFIPGGMGHVGYKLLQ